MAIGRLYQVAEITSSETTGSMLSCRGAADTVMACERASLSQALLATSEQAEAGIILYATASTGGDAAAETPIDPGDAAAAFTSFVQGGIIAIAEGIGAVYRIRQGWNELSGFLWTPANDDEVIVCAGGSGGNFDIALPLTQVAALWRVGATVREIG